MNTILERFIRKEPHFPTMYEESVMKRLSLKGAYDQGGVRSEEETFSVGKFFNRYYECFMFAALVGIKAGYELPFDRAQEGKKFLPVSDWKPKRLADYLFMSMLTLSDTDLAALDELDEKQIDDKAFDLIKLLERYAYGGFDLIDKELKENQHSFDDPFSIALFLKNVKPAA